MVILPTSIFTLGRNIRSPYLDDFPPGALSEGATLKSSLSISARLQGCRREWFGSSGAISEDATLRTPSRSSLLMALLQGCGPEFPGSSGALTPSRDPALENDIERGGEDTLDN